MNVVKFRRQPSITQLRCTKCGALADAACNCGAAYEVLARHREKRRQQKKRHKERKNQQKQQSRGYTVTKATKKSTAGNKLTQEQWMEIMEEEPPEDCNTDEQHWQWSVASFAGDANMLRAHWRKNYGKWEAFKVPTDVLTLAKQAADEWIAIVQQLERMTSNAEEQTA